MKKKRNDRQCASKCGKSKTRCASANEEDQRSKGYG